MGMYDSFRLPDEPDVEYQCKEFDCDLDWYTLDKDRRIVYLYPEGGLPDNPKYIHRRSEKLHLTYTGVIELVGNNCIRVARVSNGVMGTLYHSFWAMREDEEARDKLARKGKRYKPKPRVRYVSKAERERKRGEALKNLANALASDLSQAMNRKGFARRFLDKVKA